MQDKPQDEIDLIELLAKFIRLLKRNLALILVCIVLSLGLATWIGLTSPKVYESRMMIYSDILTESYSDQLAKNLTALIKDKNFDLLAGRLHITADQASKLREVEIEGALEGAVAEVDRQFIVVVVRILDNAVLPDLQAGIIQYISEKDFVKSRTEEKKRYYQELIASIGAEIEKLEVAKQRITTGDYGRAGGTVMMNPSDIYAQTVALIDNKLSLEEKLHLVNSVQLIEGFSPLNRHVSPKLSLLLPAGLVSGLLLAFLIMGLRYVISLARQDA